MQHDLRLREAARAIYHCVYPSGEWSPTDFDEAERHGTVHYRQSFEAAQRARGVLAEAGDQLPLSFDSVH